METATQTQAESQTRPDMSVAHTILRQLGHSTARLVLMIGAYAFAGDGTSVAFRFKCRGRDGINALRIVLDPSDTYTVEFLLLRGSSRIVKDLVDGVYAEDLRELFEQRTGLGLGL